MFRLQNEFYQLPLRFDAERLAQEVLQFTEEEWRAHPQGHAGNTALPLITVGGGMNDDVKGPMRPTLFLARCPYIQQVLASLGTVFGRSRLMRIAGQHDATPHVDTNYYWMHHVRVHIPAVTNPAVRFLCLEKSVHMAAGECWIFDSWKTHNVINPVETARIHLVADTVGSGPFWDLVSRAGEPPRAVPFDPRAASPRLALENENFPAVMSPFEQQALATRMLGDLAEPAPALARALERLHQHWHALWTEHRDAESGWPAYQKTIAEFDAHLPELAGGRRLLNGVAIIEALRQSIIRTALNPEVAKTNVATALTSGTGFQPVKNKAPAAPAPTPTVAPAPVPKVSAESSAAPNPPPVQLTVPLDRPVFIVSAPRSGSTMLFELLSRSPDVWTLGGESHSVIESLPKLDPIARGYDSNRLTEDDADDATIAELQRAFFYRLSDAQGRSVNSVHGVVRMLEKTPKNALRVRFLAEAFPGAKFIFLYREPAGNIGSIIDAWQSQRFVTYPELPDWPRPEKWSLLLLPGWQKLAASSLPEIAARQWGDANQTLLDDLTTLPPEDWCAVSYEDVCRAPQTVAEQLCAFAGWRWDQQIAEDALPLSRYTLTPPSADKWRRHEAAIAPLLTSLEPIARRAAAALRTQPPRASTSPSPTLSVAPADFSSEHTSNLGEILASIGASLAVSTYQSGKLMFVRQHQGEVNTHFRDFLSPMGLAYQQGLFAVGAGHDVQVFRAFREPAENLEPRGVHDAVFLPAVRYTTGDIRGHELAWAGRELWAVATRFSCLCTFDGEHNFLPRWRPKFISALVPEDRCHLNGLVMQDGAPKYVTALGDGDSDQSWRANKVNGGVLIDVPSGEIVARGLSMPHSPRLYDGRLWVLESGTGRVCTVDPASGKVEVVAELPGFTRGLDFAGPLAFIGLSQVRETAVFSGLPICAPGRERQCGVWVLNIKTGETVAFLRFTGSVQEVFSVQLLPVNFPELINEDHELLAGAFYLPPEAVGS